MATAAPRGGLFGRVKSLDAILATAEKKGLHRSLGAFQLTLLGIGAVIGREAVETVMGPRLHRVRRSIAERGVLAVAAIRLVPIAPFTLVNVVAGASKIPFVDYLVGTIIGMAPGLILMSALGHQLWSIVSEPTLTNILLFTLAVLAWLTVSIGAQALLLRWRRRST